MSLQITCPEHTLACCLYLGDDRDPFILRLVLVSRILYEIWARIPLPHMYSTYRSYVDQICAVIAQTYAQDQNLN